MLSRLVLHWQPANAADLFSGYDQSNRFTRQMDFDVAADETLLEAALRSGVPFAHACGGRAKCSTCRVWVLDGLEACPERNADETLDGGPVEIGG